MYSLLYLPIELTKNIVAARVYNYIRDEDKQKEWHVVAPYLLLELTRNNIAARVYNYIRDEDKGKERHAVAPYLLLELSRNNIAARVYNYIRDEDKQATAREQETEICFRFDIGELSWIAYV